LRSGCPSKHLAFHPVGGGEEIHRAGDAGVLCGNGRLDAHPVNPPRRHEVVDHLEARRSGQVVYGREVGEHVEFERRVVLQQAQHVEDLRPLHQRRGVAVLRVRVEQRLRLFLEEPP
jgi:Ser-tRNA(Ala) deacylase AlaX